MARPGGRIPRQRWSATFNISMHRAKFRCRPEPNEKGTMRIPCLFACAAGLALLGVGGSAIPPPPPRLDPPHRPNASRAPTVSWASTSISTAGPDCTEIGKNTTRAMIENIIDQVHPDYLQIDCKGHRGLSSYPTKVGNPAPGFVGDPLRLWRQVTAERGVSLYMHYSGVWDSEAISQHPDWAVINADGKTNDQRHLVLRPVRGRAAHPAITRTGRRLRRGRRVGGRRMLGRKPDYGEAALKAFREATGIQTFPASQAIRTGTNC